jgi:hypothetical protein
MGDFGGLDRSAVERGELVPKRTAKSGVKKSSKASKAKKPKKASNSKKKNSPQTDADILKLLMKVKKANFVVPVYAQACSGTAPTCVACSIVCGPLPPTTGCTAVCTLYTMPTCTGC